MKTRKVIFFSILCAVIANASAQGSVVCSNCPNITLGETEKMISYKSNETNCVCSWPLNTSMVMSRTISIAVIQINASLTSDSGCAATVAIPGKEHSCNEAHICRVHHARNTKCQRSEVLDAIKAKGQRCNTFHVYTQKIEKKISFSATAQKDGGYSFNILYIPINCSQLISAETTTQVSEETTATERNDNTVKNVIAEITTTSNRMIITDAETIQKQTTTEAPNPIFTTIPDQSESPSDSRARIISIVVPLVILLIIFMIAVVFLLIWYKKKRTTQTNRGKTIADAGQTQTRV